MAGAAAAAGSALSRLSKLKNKLNRLHDHGTGDKQMKRRTLLKSTALALALAAGSLMPQAFAPAPAVAQTKGGTLNVIVNPEPPILMLGLNQQGPTQYVAGKIYESLLTYDTKLTPKPGLAESWSISPDGLVYSFKLRSGVTWHDGKPFTAADVAFTADKFLRETHPRFRGLIARVAKIETPDDHSISFTLKEPFAPFIMAFEVSTMPIVPKHLYDGTDFKTNPANQTPIGTGPFKFKEWKKGNYIHLVRNDAYWAGGKPYLDEIYFRVIPDAASRALAYETGAVDVLRGGDVENFDVERLRALPQTEFTTAGWEMFAPVNWMQVNTTKAPMDDKRFRQAMMYAIDRKFIADNIWFGLGKPATSPINSKTLFHSTDVPKYDYNPKKAIALLDEMGLKPDGAKIRATLRMMPIPYGEVWQRQAEYVRQQLLQVGIKVTMENVDAGAWAQKVGEFDFDLTFNFLYQYGDPALGVSRNYISTNIVKGTPFGNNGGYKNPKVDELFAQAASAVSADERAKLYAEVQKILVDDLPIVWLTEMEFPTLYRSKWKNLVTTAIGLNETFSDVYQAK